MSRFEQPPFESVELSDIERRARQEAVDEAIGRMAEDFPIPVELLIAAMRKEIENQKKAHGGTQ